MQQLHEQSEFFTKQLREITLEKKNQQQQIIQQSQNSPGVVLPSSPTTPSETETSIAVPGTTFLNIFQDNLFIFFKHFLLPRTP